MSSKDNEILLAIVWHMHQPDYRNRRDRSILLPWVRLHALKDYYDMPARLRRYPGIHQTFNVVPSLMEQLKCYQGDEWHELELDLFIKPADQLSEEDRFRILESFFMAPEERMIRPYPRYTSLLRESRLWDHSDLLRRWTPQEWRDLQFWRQLAWIDPLIREEDPFFADLVQSGQNFTEDQKSIFITRMRHWLQRSFNIYHEMQDEGLIEVSITPYYHPILPLLIDPSSVKEAMPDCPLPEQSGCHPEDARIQLERAARFYQECMGRPICGLWPSEGSVSQDAAVIIGEVGFQWMASDEEILARSLGHTIRKIKDGSAIASEELYQPYQTLDGKGPAIVFRDHRLSDLIGFEYSHWDPERAASHFVAEIQAVRHHWNKPYPPLVTVILDGENCWEYYQNDGGPFLDHLYQKLQEAGNIRSVTVSEGLESVPSTPLKRLAAGSWIHGNFHIWMGEEADRRAWTLLEETRRKVVEAEQQGHHPAEKIAEAWEEIYTAEGSDWFWWFGESHSSQQDNLFDEMFRLHLVCVHEILNLPIPPYLHIPIEAPTLKTTVVLEPYLPTPPMIDGMDSHYYEWRAAAIHDPERSGGAMQHNLQAPIHRILYGVDEKCFYLRIDPTKPLKRKGQMWRWELKVTSPAPLTIRFTPTTEGFLIERVVEVENETESQQEWIRISDGEIQVAEQTIFEAAIPWSLLEAQEGEALSFILGYPLAHSGSGHLPVLSSLCVKIPSKDKPGRNWFP